MKTFKRVLSSLMAVAVLASSAVLFTGCQQNKSTGNASPTINIDGKKDSQWDGVKGVTVANGAEGVVVDNVAEGIDVTSETNSKNKATVYFRYDANYLYILEERESAYLNMAYKKSETIFMKYGDSTRLNIMLYDPNGDQTKQPNYSTFLIYTANCKDGEADDTEPVLLIGQNCFNNTTAVTPKDETTYKIKSTLNVEQTKATTEIAISWNSLFINCPELPVVGNGKDVKSIITEGLVFKYGLSLNVGTEDARSRRYSLDYCFDGDPKTDMANVETMNDWATMTVKGDSLEVGGAGAPAQIDWRALAKEAKEAGEGFPWKTILIWVGIVIVVLLIGTLIIFKVLNISFTAEAEEDDDEDEEEEEEEEDDDDF